MEQMRKVDTVVLDKTGTVTEGRPVVTGWLHDAGWQNEHKGILYAAELKSEHPLALAIVEALKRKVRSRHSLILLRVGQDGGLW